MTKKEDGNDKQIQEANSGLVSKLSKLSFKKVSLVDYEISMKEYSEISREVVEYKMEDVWRNSDFEAYRMKQIVSS